MNGDTVTKNATVNRGWLARQMAKGLVEGKCEFHYTDDYLRDAEENFGETDWAPVVFTEGRAPEGVIRFDSHDLKTATGWASLLGVDSEGVQSVRLHVHSNRAYLLRVRPATKKPRTRKAASK